MWAQAKILLFKLLELIHNGITSVGISTNFAWGLAIIALTLLVRLAMHPLTAKQMKSMQKMQKLQPQLQVLQEKYADDKDKLNQETMALYKENNVNPASGCLPLIIQLPIFIRPHQDRSIHQRNVLGRESWRKCFDDSCRRFEAG